MSTPENMEKGICLNCDVVDLPSPNSLSCPGCGDPLLKIAGVVIEPVDQANADSVS